MSEPTLLTAGVSAQVSRDAPPPLPGGYKLGEKVFFTGVSKTFDDGDKLVHGQQGEVTGHATAESHKGKGVHVLFPGNEGVANLLLTSVRRLRAASAATPAPACPAPQTHGAAHTPPSRATCVFPGAPAAPWRRPNPNCKRISRRSPTPSERGSGGGPGAGGLR